MKPNVFGLALVFGAVFAVPSAAQQAPTQPPASEPAHKIYVLTGCLTATPAAPDVFKLTGAAPVGQAPAERSAANPAAKDAYELLATTGLIEQGVTREALQTHVGRKVEVTVRPVEVSPGTSSSSSSPTPLPSTAKIEDAAPQRYSVTQNQVTRGLLSAARRRRTRSAPIEIRTALHRLEKR